MRKLLTISVLLVSLCVHAQIGGKNFIDQNYIEVTGKAEVEVVPNEIYLKIVLSETDNKNKIPVTEQEIQMAEKLKELGIDISKDLLLKDMGSNFQKYFLSKDAILLSKEYQLKVNSGKLAGQVFIELEKIGISNISIDKLDHSDMDTFKNEVKVEAIKAAKVKANVLASALEQTIGKAIYIQEKNNYQPYQASNSVMIRGVASRSEAQPLEIDFEKIKLSYSILVRFALD